jgi:hypothetical protein
MYEFYVRKKISVSLETAEEGKVISHEKVKERMFFKR